VGCCHVSCCEGFRTQARGARGTVTHRAGIRNPSQLQTLNLLFTERGAVVPQYGKERGILNIVVKIARDEVEES
jgi:hypothetical protein